MTVDALDVSRLFYAYGNNWNTTAPVALTAPQNLSGNPGDGAVLWSWDDVPGATSYDYRVNSGSWNQLADGVTQINTTGHTNGVAVNFDVRPRNLAGPGNASTISSLARTPAASGSGGISIADSITRNWATFNTVSDGAGRVSILNDYSYLSSTGEHVFLIAREMGARGAVSVNYVTAGDTHDIESGTVSWLDGDATIHALKVNVSSKAAGEHRIYLQLSGPTGGLVLHNGNYTRAYGVIDDDTVPSNTVAVFFNTALSNGVGTAESPFNNIYDAIALADTDPQYRYVCGQGTVIPDGTNSSAPYGKVGIFSIDAPANRTSEENRIIVRDWPGAGGGSLTISGNGQNNTFGFFNSGNASYCTYKNITFTDLDSTNVNGTPGSGVWYHYGNYIGITTELCVFDVINGSENNGGVNYYGTLGAKVYKSSFKEIQKDGDNTNGNTGGVYSYKGENISIQHCDFASTMSKGFYLKGTELGEVSVTSRFNIFRNVPAYFGQQGGGDPGHFGMIVSFCVFTGVKAYVYHRALDLQVGVGENAIYNNYFYGAGDGVRGAIEMAYLEDVRIFNNIIHNCKFVWSDQSSEATDIPQFVDNNVVFNLTSNYSSLDFVSRDKAATNTALGTSFGVSDSSSDPNTVDAANDDFHSVTPITIGVGGDRVGPYLSDDFTIGLAA